MPRFAAIDVGSNAMRLRVVEATGPHELREVATERAAVRLGHDVFLTGRLAPAAMIEAIEALKGFRDVMRGAGVESYRAVATSAVREAANAPVLVERAEREAGVKLEVIEGIEEARLVLEAVRHSVKIGARRAILVDIGGGSVELTWLSPTGENTGGERRSQPPPMQAKADPGPTGSVSLPMGTVRLCEAFLDPEGPVTAERRSLLVEYIERFLTEARLSRSERPELVVVTGGNAEAIAQLCPAASTDGNGVSVARMRALRDELSELAPKARRERFGLRGDRADVIVPAVYVLCAVADTLGVSEMVAPGVGLKDGILAELVERAFRVWDESRERASIEAQAVGLGRKYRFDETHARHVADLALSLFDQLSEVHKLGAEERALLKLAALVHDIGDFVGYESHHKHTQYIVAHADLMGLTPTQREVVANVARYHRKALPDLSHPSFRKLERRERAVVRKLAALLRVADAFDREHQTKVRDLSVRLVQNKLTLRATGEGDLSLERWTALRKADLMEDVFEVSVRVEGTEAMSVPKGYQ